jgi:hypothetical protein
MGATVYSFNEFVKLESMERAAPTTRAASGYGQADTRPAMGSGGAPCRRLGASKGNMNGTKDRALDEVIGARMRFARTARNIGQAQLGRRIGLLNPSSDVHRFEKGTRSVPKRLLIPIARVFGVSIHWLLSGRIFTGPSMPFMERPTR